MIRLQTRFVADRGRIPLKGTTLPGYGRLARLEPFS